MKELDDFTIAIVGLGLMGGSLALALKQNGIGQLIQGVDANVQSVRRACELNVIDAPCESFDAVDLIALAMPVRAIVNWLDTHSKSLSRDCIVMDLGSTKQIVMAAMENVSAQCIGAHPMCGTERSGIESADRHLYFGAKFVLTPTSHTTDETLRIVQTMVQRIGAQPVAMDATTHDRAVAAISHLPYLLSVNLVNTVTDRHDEQASLLAASGYQSMTRLASGEPHVMADIITTNRLNILDMLDHYQSELAQLREAIADGDEGYWRTKLEQARVEKLNTRPSACKGTPRYEEH